MKETMEEEKDITIEQPKIERTEISDTINGQNIALLPSDGNKWSWSSWLIGAPPVDIPDGIAYTGEIRSSEDATDLSSLPTKTSLVNVDTAKKSIKSASNWLWSNASYIINQATAVDNEEEDTATIRGSYCQDDISERGERTKSEEKESGSASGSWFDDSIWSNMRQDLAELALSVKTDTKYLLDNKDAARATIRQGVDLINKATKSTVKILESLILTEEELAGELESVESANSLSQLENIPFSNDRVRRQLAVMLTGPSPLIFEFPPEPEDEFRAWLQLSADSAGSPKDEVEETGQPITGRHILESSAAEIGQLLLDHESVRREYTRLVLQQPAQLDHQQFFLRYLFHKHRLETSDRRRAAMKARLYNSNIDEQHTAGQLQSASGEEQLPLREDSLDSWGNSSDEETASNRQQPIRKEQQTASSAMVVQEREDLLLVRHPDSNLDSSPSKLSTKSATSTPESICSEEQDKDLLQSSDGHTESNDWDEEF